MTVNELIKVLQENYVGGETIIISADAEGNEYHEVRTVEEANDRFAVLIPFDDYLEEEEVYGE